MAEEPINHKMDELLRSYAKKRRDDAGEPLEMHAVTRKILQDEAAKLRPEPGPGRESFSALLARLMPKLLVAASLSVVVIAAVVLLRTGPREPQQLAQNFHKPVSSPVARDAPPLQSQMLDQVKVAEPANHTGLSMSRQEVAAEKHEAVPTKLKLATAPPVVAPPVSPRGLTAEARGPQADKELA